MSFVGPIIGAGAALGPSRTDAGTRPFVLAIATVLFAVAVAQQVWLGLDTDVSWLLTVGEKVLDGNRLYVDIFEVNPPASVLIYLPAILAARVLGVTPEFATAAMTFGLAGLSLAACGYILCQAQLTIAASRSLMLIAGIFSLTVLPGLSFAQREHIALIALLPFLAVAAVRASGSTVDRPLTIAAGIGAGLTMAIKPHFVLAVAPVIAWTAWRRRSAREALGPEVRAAGAVVAAYGVGVMALFPEYLTDAVPMLRDVYLPVRTGMFEMARTPTVIWTAVAGSAALLLARKDLPQDGVAVLLIAAAGFAGAMVLQGKGYSNHALPAAGLAVLALALAVAQADVSTMRKICARAILILVSGLLWLISGPLMKVDYPEVANLVRRVAPPNPRILVAGSNLSIGHPLTRWVGGEWVGSRGALWATGAAVETIAKVTDDAMARRLRAYVDQDRRLFVRDIETRNPDVILVSGNAGMSWIKANSDVSLATKDYRNAGSNNGVVVLVRRESAMKQISRGVHHQPHQA